MNRGRKGGGEGANSALILNTRLFGSSGRMCLVFQIECSKRCINYHEEEKRLFCSVQISFLKYLILLSNISVPFSTKDCVLTGRTNIQFFMQLGIHLNWLIAF